MPVIMQKRENTFNIKPFNYAEFRLPSSGLEQVCQKISTGVSQKRLIYMFWIHFQTRIQTVNTQIVSNILLQPYF